MNLLLLMLQYLLFVHKNKTSIDKRHDVPNDSSEEGTPLAKLGGEESLVVYGPWKVKERSSRGRSLSLSQLLVTVKTSQNPVSPGNSHIQNGNSGG